MGLELVQRRREAAVRGHGLFLRSGCGVAMGRRFCAANSVCHWSMKRADTNTQIECVLPTSHPLLKLADVLQKSLRMPLTY